MFSGFEQAITTSAVALIGIYLTQFVAEQYRRFRDGSAIAAGLLGELRSYKSDHEKLQTALKNWIQIAKNHGKDALMMWPLPKHTDPFFESCVGKIGLLKDDLVTDCIFVYYRIRAFKEVLTLVTENHHEMQDAEFVIYCEGLLEMIQKAVEVGEPLLVKLEKRAKAKFIIG